LRATLGDRAPPHNGASRVARKPGAGDIPGIRGLFAPVLPVSADKRNARSRSPCLRQTPVFPTPAGAATMSCKHVVQNVVA